MGTGLRRVIFGWLGLAAISLFVGINADGQGLTVVSTTVLLQGLTPPGSGTTPVHKTGYYAEGDMPSADYSLAATTSSGCPINRAGITGTIVGTTLTVSTVTSGSVVSGAMVTGTGVSAGQTVLTQTGASTYLVSISQSITTVQAFTLDGDGGSQIPLVNGSNVIVGCATLMQQASVNPRIWGAHGTGTANDDLAAIQSAVTYVASLSSLGTFAAVDLGRGTYGISCPVVLPGTGSGGNTLVGGVGLTNGSLIATSNFCPYFPLTAGTNEPIPMVIVENGSYQATIRDLFLQCNFVSSGLLVIPGAASPGSQTYKTVIDNLRVERYVNPLLTNELNYDPNYNSTAYGRLYFTYLSSSTRRFQTGDTVTGSTFGATATVYNIDNKALTVTGLSGTFSDSDSISAGSGTSVANGMLTIPNNDTNKPPIGGLYPINLPPPASTNTYRPYGMRFGTLQTAVPANASSQAVIIRADMRQFSNSDTSSGSKTQDNMTGIGAWFSSTNNTVLNLTASGNRKGLVVDFSDNTFDNVHAFPIGLPATPNPTVREWIDIELNAGNNIFNNTYLDHGEVWANDPRNVFMNGRIVNIAVPRTSISSAFVIPVPAGCASPCDLSKWGPLVIDGLWYNNDVTSPPANSGVPTLFKYWEPAGSGTSFAGHAPLELAADQGSYFSNTRDFYGAGSTNTAVTHFYGGNNREALIQLQDASTPPGKTNGFGSLGGCAVVNTGGIDVPICAGSAPPTTISASPPALYFNSVGGSMTTLYVKQSGGSGATGWSGVSTMSPNISGNSGSVQQAGNTTNYYIPMGQSASGNTLLNYTAKMAVPVAGTAGNLKVTASAPGSGQSYTITLYAGNTATSLACTISGTATQCSDTTDFPAFTAGQDMSLQIVTSSGAASAPFRWGLTFQGP